MYIVKVRDYINGLLGCPLKQKCPLYRVSTIINGGSTVHVIHVHVPVHEGSPTVGKGKSGEVRETCPSGSRPQHTGGTGPPGGGSRIADESPGQENLHVAKRSQKEDYAIT